MPGTARRREVQDRVFELFAEQFGVATDQITDATSLVDDLGADSLDTVEVTMEVEEEFDIIIPDEEAEQLHTVGQFVDFVVEHTG